METKSLHSAAPPPPPRRGSQLEYFIAPWWPHLPCLLQLHRRVAGILTRLPPRCWHQGRLEQHRCCWKVAAQTQGRCLQPTPGSHWSSWPSRTATRWSSPASPAASAWSVLPETPAQRQSMSNTTPSTYAWTIAATNTCWLRLSKSMNCCASLRELCTSSLCRCRSSPSVRTAVTASEG